MPPASPRETAPAVDEKNAALAAAAGAAAEEMEKEAARKNMALVAQAAEKVAKGAAQTDEEG